MKFARAGNSLWLLWPRAKALDHAHAAGANAEKLIARRKYIHGKRSFHASHLERSRAGRANFPRARAGSLTLKIKCCALRTIKDNVAERFKPAPAACAQKSCAATRARPRKRTVRKIFASCRKPRCAAKWLHVRSTLRRRAPVIRMAVAQPAARKPRNLKVSNSTLTCHVRARSLQIPAMPHLHSRAQRETAQA